jgi:hypothetical protein
MDFDHINTLLSVFHKSLNVPHTDLIRVAIIEELKVINAAPEAPAPADPEPELEFGARRV